jgi:flagellar hook-length control protein FliK
MAQMVSRAAQSEMHIGMNTTAFGTVDIHTVVHANEVGIQIGSEKGDLRSLLTNELPSIAHSLQQQNLRLNPVAFHQGLGFSNNQSSGGNAQSRSFSSSSNTSKPGPAESPSTDATSFDSGESTEPSTIGHRFTGLNILA